MQGEVEGKPRLKYKKIKTKSLSAFLSESQGMKFPCVPLWPEQR